MPAMPETGQPTVEQRPPGAEGIRLNLWYFTTLPGIIKIFELGLGLACVILGYPTPYGRAFFLVTAYTSLSFTVILIFIYALSVREVLPYLPWVHIEFIITMINALLLVSGSTFLYMAPVFTYHTRRHYTFAATFGVVNTFLFVVDVYLLFVGYRR